MPRRQNNPYEKYTLAQKSIKDILSKYNGSRQTILDGKRIFISSKNEEFRKHNNDCRNLQRFEKIVKEYEDSITLPPPATP